ncbi:MFS transporter [Sphingomonas koreensis]|uniref:MFS transporter n=4 Tax=Sphingomonas koreensis TaxID=93064 RepID=A0AAJ4S7Q5_9SPHN|nr:MFS transporter [Sphingomonas koreensis]RSU27048.1 MFS transporter [Sphingomonas koreensis]RSU29997.1 MFS transporter [Sphingomonas koreensis]RSU32883.1 MFS transporter [Sphingomonas koreensis]RSU40718.1 MFS transporter [Sphingomonas koreensis]
MEIIYSPPMSQIPSNPSAAGLPGPSQHLMLAVICGAQFLVVIDAVVLMVAGPALTHAFGAAERDLQWVFNAYALTFGGLLLLAGRIGDRVGHRRVFAAGAVVFALSSFVGALSQSMEMLIAARALQGMGSAMLAANALALLTLHFPAGPARIRALGLFASSATVGVASGTLLGGLLTSYFGWSSVLLVNIPLGLAMAWATIGAAGRTETGAVLSPTMDWAGAATATLGFGTLTLGIAELAAPTHHTVALLVVAAGLLSVFVVVERRSKAPLLDLTLFRFRPVAAGNALIFLHSAGPLVMLFFGSLYFQQVRGLSALETGLLFLPMALASIVAARLAPAIMARLTPRLVTSLGFGLMGVASLILSQLPAAPEPFFIASAVALALGGFGAALSFVCLTEAATASADASEAGMISGLVNTSLQMGGASVLAIVLAAATAGATAPLDIHAGAFGTAAGLLFVGAVAGLLILPGKSGR